MFDEAINTVTEEAVNVVVDNTPEVVADKAPEIVDAVTEVTKNAEWKLDSKSFGEGLCTGLCIAGVIYVVPKVVDVVKGWFRKPKEYEFPDDDTDDTGDNTESDTQPKE